MAMVAVLVCRLICFCLFDHFWEDVTNAGSDLLVYTSLEQFDRSFLVVVYTHFHWGSNNSPKVS